VGFPNPPLLVLTPLGPTVVTFGIGGKELLNKPEGFPQVILGTPEIGFVI
jgi:hypothetical protein